MAVAGILQLRSVLWPAFASAAAAMIGSGQRAGRGDAVALADRSNRGEMEPEAVLTRTGRCTLDERNGIVRFEVFVGAEQSADDARENMDAVLKVSGGKRYPLLVNLATGKTLGQKARDVYGNPELRSRYRAIALVGGSPVSRMGANMWLAIYGNREFPTKMFAIEADAIAWLKEFAA